MTDLVKEAEKEIIDSAEASDRGHFHALGLFASLPSPIHPSICPPPTHLPSHPSCPAGQALPSICCLSQLGAALFPPSTCIYNSIKSNNPFFLLPLLFLPLLLLLLLLLFMFFSSCAWMSTAERPYTPCRDAVMTHT